MTDLLLLLAIAALSALTVRAMIRRGVLDVPGRRSSHDRPTPKGGGIGIALATLLGVLGAASTGRAGSDVLPAIGLAVAVLLIGAVAWADDLRQFGFAWKLGSQVAAALILVASGFVLRRIGPLALGALSVPLTVCAILFVTNAMNFIDGLNGLASGCALIVSVSVAARAITVGMPLEATASLSLAAGIAGFLPFNYPRARIFMGDVGSQVCGIVLSAIAVRGDPLLPGHAGVLLPLLGLLAILADVAFTLARRLVAGDRLTEAHRGHLYQLAFRAGLPVTVVTPVYWSLTLAGCAAALLGAGSRTGTILAVLAEIAVVAVWAAVAIRSARQTPIGRW